MFVKKILISILLLLFLGLDEQYEIEFNVKNNTNYAITYLNVYSQRFKNLKPNDSTSYKKIMFDELTHNSIINLTVEKKQFIIYIPKPVKERSTINIDSLDIKNRIIYYKVFSK